MGVVRCINTVLSTCCVLIIALTDLASWCYMSTKGTFSPSAIFFLALTHVISSIGQQDEAELVRQSGVQRWPKWWLGSRCQQIAAGNRNLLSATEEVLTGLHVQAGKGRHCKQTRQRERQREGDGGDGETETRNRMREKGIAGVICVYVHVCVCVVCNTFVYWF